MSVSHHRSSRFALLAATILAGTPALAAPDKPALGSDDAQKAAPDPQEVVVNGQRVVDAGHAPAQGNLDAVQPQSLVSQRFIEDVAPTNGDYSQTIKFTPSFSFSAPNGSGGSESKSQVLRGFADGQYNVTIDGIPFGDTNDFTHHTTSFFPAGVLGNVSVDRGPGIASTIGYATFGGTISLHSRALADGASAFVRGGYGSFNDRLAVAEAQSGRVAATGGTRVIADYLYHQTDGALDYAGLKTQQIVAKLEQPLGGNWTLTAFGSFNHTRYENWNPITPNQRALYGLSFGALNDNPNSVLYRGYNYKVKNADVEYLRVAGGVAGFAVEDMAYSYDYRNHERNGNNPLDLGLTPVKADAGYGTLVGPKGNLDIIGNRQLNQYRAYGNILNIAHPINAGIGSGTLRAGLWYEHQDNRREQYLVDWTLGGVLNAAPGADPLSFNGRNALGQTGTGAYVYRIASKVDTVQPFAEYDWTPAHDVLIIMGVKHIDFTRTQRADINQGSLLPIDFKKTWSATLPSISANWRIEPATSLYAQVALGFLAPNVNVFYTGSVAKNDFQPQKTKNYQAGIVHQGKRFNADIDAYYIDFDNFITTVTDFSVTPNQTYSVNGGGVIYKGVEAQASVTLAHAVSVFAAGSVNSAKTKGSDKLSGGDLWVAGAPDHTVSLGLLYDDGELYGTVLGKRVGARYFGANRTNLRPLGGVLVPTAAAQIVDPATGNGYTANRLGAYDTVDLTLGYRFKVAPVGRSLKVEFQIQNLLDNRRASDTNGRLLARAGDTVDPAATTFTYLAPRAFSGAVTIGF